MTSTFKIRSEALIDTHVWIRYVQVRTEENDLAIEIGPMNNSHSTAVYKSGLAVEIDKNSFVQWDVADYKNTQV